MESEGPARSADTVTSFRKVNIMKNWIRAVLLCCAFGAPVAAFAQTVDGSLTRADVRADLVRVEKAGYRPVASDPYYPDDVQAAEAKVAARQSVAAQPDADARTSGHVAAATSLASNDTERLFEHH
ncbi:DUF4148 domain-containing protein [Burkholderia dolosa]|jgi:hypothetical protein|uniref:Purine nucleoside phosphorylase n=2 Tax=Burkholderia TaxID=32008 RepID=B9BQR0_9BURK|nr:conserved hypothetical protein [Burkholderia multivorans CGD2]EEE13100.1 conserved hypothetical protein [Burkholderia multivorans CGD2M]MBR8060385.1 DUF4148 domain-containing protein [Burkholderia dolosa]QET31238.1 DUF4148 domain-containing protein [Burkholderia multivorans]MBR8303803.1 DUF4148 domain-containing protein [Burkholderia dolosa]